MKPQISIGGLEGVNNANLEVASERLGRQGVYRDLSTIIVVPALENVPAKIAFSWWNLMSPPNQKVVRILAQGMEVGAAYSSTIESILATPDLAKFKYLLTIEHDNAPPPDGLLRLLESIEANPQYAAIGGLYWTKGELGVPQIWGDPHVTPMNFQPQAPKGGIQECNGTGMGFTLFKLDMFKDSRLRKPWFETRAKFDPNKGSELFTQDLWFWHDARKYYRCAIDNDVKVGHYDVQNDMMW